MILKNMFYLSKVRIGRTDCRSLKREEILKLLPNKIDKLITLDLIKVPYDDRFKAPGVIVKLYSG